MSEALPPIDLQFANVLVAHKSDFVDSSAGNGLVQQLGGASLDISGFPGWPAGLTATEPVIETYVASPSGIAATSDNQPFVDAWTPLVSWMDTQVRTELGSFDCVVAGDAYVTASLTATKELEGLAHMDDDSFVPDDPVGIVAIIGQLLGPRAPSPGVALSPQTAPQPMGQIVFDDATLAAFEGGDIEQHRCGPDELVIFPQFGQLHAGPAAHHVSDLSEFRQLLVYRARAIPG